MPPNTSTYWFHYKNWAIIIPVAILIPYIWNLIVLSGYLNDVEDINIEKCQKMSGPPDFSHCEDFVFSGEPGVAYVNCDPAIKYHNQAMGIYRTNPTGVTENGAIWQVDYSQQPATLEKFNMGSLNDYHPLGMELDIHPITGFKRIISVNTPHNNTPAIEFFTIEDDQLIHLRSIRHPEIHHPNSVHALHDERFRADDGTPSFFFSNDHYFHSTLLKKIEPFLFPLSSVHFYNARTGQVKKVVKNLLFANGVSGSDDLLFVNDLGRSTIRQYKINRSIDQDGLPTMYLDHLSQVTVGGAPDNLRYHPTERVLTIAAMSRLGDAFKRMAADPDDRPNSPSKVVVWDIATGQTKVVLQDDGSLFSASTAAAFDFDNSILILSGIVEEGLLICDL